MLGEISKAIKCILFQSLSNPELYCNSPELYVVEAVMCNIESL